MNSIEKFLMNNPVRSAVQKYWEVPKLLKMGGVMQGGRALEIGCGRGVGTKLILQYFNADHVDAFDLDPEMVALARHRLQSEEGQVNLWVGDATNIQAEDSTYDAIFDFGIIHHILDWEKAVSEVSRVLKTGGRFYAEEVFESFITSPIWRRILKHPQEDRFNHGQFKKKLEAKSFNVIATEQAWERIGWFVAEKKLNS